MKNRTQNQLNMAGACFNVAHQPEYEPVWMNQEPLAFGQELALLETDFKTVRAKAALAEVATGGSTDAKVQAKSTLEAISFAIARALAFHFKRLGDADRLGKTNLRRSGIVRQRNQDLLNRANSLRDLAVVAVLEPEATNRGITDVRVDQLTAAIAAFTNAMNNARGQVANRGALLKDTDRDTAAIAERLRDMDDLVVQFDNTELGGRFRLAWKQARQIVDLGGRPAFDAGEGAPTPAPNPPSPAVALPQS